VQLRSLPAGTEGGVEDTCLARIGELEPIVTALATAYGGSDAIETDDVIQDQDRGTVISGPQPPSKAALLLSGGGRAALSSLPRSATNGLVGGPGTASLLLTGSARAFGSAGAMKTTGGNGFGAAAPLRSHHHPPPHTVGSAAVNHDVDDEAEEGEDEAVEPFSEDEHGGGGAEETDDEAEDEYAARPELEGAPPEHGHYEESLLNGDPEAQDATAQAEEEIEHEAQWRNAEQERREDGSSRWLSLAAAATPWRGGGLGELPSSLRSCSAFRH
jgi:hypothetical protein